jgi:small GTP-binding protein
MSVISYIFKIIVVGSHSTGKTTLVNRFIDKENFQNCETTIGVEFCTKTINVKNKLIKLQIWDTAGQERFRSIIKSYYRGASGALVCFDINNRNEFLEVPDWIEKIRKLNINKEVEIMVVATKVDSKKENHVTFEELKNLSEEYNVNFFEVSSYKFINIDEPFIKLSNKIIDKLNNNIHYNKLNVKSIFEYEDKLLEHHYRYDSYLPRRCCTIL